MTLAPHAGGTGDPARREAVTEAASLTPGLIHELRQPLLGVKAGLAIVAGDLGEQVTSRPEWDLVLGQLARVEEILHGWQQLFDPGAAPLADFALAPVVQRAAELLRFRTRRLGDRFAVTCLPGAVAFGDPRHLLHALVNLLANAIDAVEQRGAGRVELRLVAPPAGGRCDVRVADDGCGVPPDLRARIFEARFTTKGERGSGLGLLVARAMVEASGGAVVLVDDGDPSRAPWARTEFSIRLRTPEVP